MRRAIGALASRACTFSFMIPVRALALAADRPLLWPVSVALFVLLSPFLVVAWLAYVVAAFTTLGSTDTVERN